MVQPGGATIARGLAIGKQDKVWLCQAAVAAILDGLYPFADRMLTPAPRPWSPRRLQRRFGP